MSTPLPPRKRWRAAAEPGPDEAGSGPSSASESLSPKESPDPRGSTSSDDVQPCGRRSAIDVPEAVTTFPASRKRQASERCGQRAEGRSSIHMADSAAPGPSQSPDGENHPRRPESPNQPAAAFTTAALILRGTAVLTGEGERPRASGDVHTASEATLVLILAICVAAEKLWKDREMEIRRCCAPSLPTGLIDGQEVFGYLLADVLGRPLLHSEDARGVGRDGNNAVAKAKKMTGGQKKAESAHEALQ